MANTVLRDKERLQDIVGTSEKAETAHPSCCKNIQLEIRLTEGKMSVTKHPGTLQRNGKRMDIWIESSATGNMTVFRTLAKT